jgi:hypothetical protein
MYWRIAIRENPLGRIDDGIKISAAVKEVRFAMDSPLEGAGFEPSVPRQGERLAVQSDQKPAGRPRWWP